MRKLLILVVTITVAVGCGDLVQEDREHSGAGRWRFESAAPTDRANGGRSSSAPLEYWRLQNPRLRRVVRSTAVLVDRDRLETGANDETLEVSAPLGGRCGVELGSRQPAPGICTAFLAGPRTLVTAGHCLRNRPECEETRAVFGFYYRRRNDEPLPVERHDVYSCRRVLHRHQNRGGVDFAVVRLDRPVRDRPPLQLAGGSVAERERRVALVGAPGGLPVKVARGGTLAPIDRELVEYDLPVRPGHSGSPVVAESTGRVVAVHVRAADRRGGRRGRRPPESGCDARPPAARAGRGTRARRLVGRLAPTTPKGWFELTARRVATGDREGTFEFYVPSIGTLGQGRLELRVRGNRLPEIAVAVVRRLPGVGGELRLLEPSSTSQSGEAGGEPFRRSLRAFQGRSPRGIWRVHLEDSAPPRAQLFGATLEFRTQSGPR